MEDAKKFQAELWPNIRCVTTPSGERFYFPGNSFRMLETLYNAGGDPVTHEDISRAVLGDRHEGSKTKPAALTGTCGTQLRTILAGSGLTVNNLHGIGYYLVEDYDHSKPGVPA